MASSRKVPHIAGLADELAADNIAVNTVHPGATRTEATTPETEARRQPNLVGRMIDASEVADVVVFLVSPRASYVSGTVVTIDGGATNRNV